MVKWDLSWGLRDQNLRLQKNLKFVQKSTNLKQYHLRTRANPESKKRFSRRLENLFEKNPSVIETSKTNFSLILHLSKDEHPSLQQLNQLSLPPFYFFTNNEWGSLRKMIRQSFRCSSSKNSLWITITILEMRGFPAPYLRPPNSSKLTKIN